MMSGRKVIQDSDDEDDNGEQSSVLLNREIQNAHLSLLESSTTSSSRPSLPSSGSPPATSMSRKRAISVMTSPKIVLGEEIPPSSSAPASSPVKRARLDSRLDLPPEQYQPRPSRSRSTLAADDIVVPTDFSKRPETLAKNENKSKQQKAAASQPTRASPKRRQAKLAPEAPEDANEQDAIEEQSRKESNSTLDNHPAFQPEAIPPTKSPSPKPQRPKKPRGRPKKDPAIERDTNPPTPDPPPTDNGNPPESPIPTNPVPAPPPAKRGRKRKSAPAQELSSAIVHDDVDDDVDDDDPPVDQAHQDPGFSPATTLTDADPNIRPSRNEPEQSTETEISPPETKSSKHLESPKKQQTAVVKAGVEKAMGTGIPAKYRVGLSKRQSIPSLLRVMRK